MTQFSEGYNGKVQRKNSYSHLYPSHDEDVRYYINDVERGAYAGVARDIVDQDEKSAILFTFDDDKAKKEFEKHIGMPIDSMEKASDIPKAVRQKRDKVAHVYQMKPNEGSEGYYRYRRRPRYEAKQGWDTANIDIDDGGVYVNIYDWRVIGTGWNGDAPQDVAQTLHEIRSSGLKVPKVYGVRNTQVQKFQEHSKWTELRDWMDREVPKFIKKKNLKGSIEVVSEWGEFDTPAILDVLVEGKKLIMNEDIQAFIKKYEGLKAKVEKCSSEVQKTRKIAENMKVDIDSALNISVTPLETHWATLMDKFPLLKLIESHYYRPRGDDKLKIDSKIFADYVNLL